MTNYEKIKNMSVEEMAEKITQLSDKICANMKNCKDCPLRLSRFSEGGCRYEGFLDWLEKNDSNALEKQIPKKPLEQKYGFCDLVGFFYVRLVCPECKKSIVNVRNKAEYKPNHCHYCGQALDWSEVEE